jgi:hypothetical protein
MSLLGLNLTLSVGSMTPDPAPLQLTQALQSVEVTRSDEGPSAFQLTFYADRSGPFQSDYPLLRSPLLKLFNRILITVTFNGTPRVLMDGFITHHQLMPGDASKGSTLVVTGEDVSVLMDLVDLPFEYPSMSDAMIVLFILAKYSLIGIYPEVIPPLTTFLRLPLEGTWQQTGTDRANLNKLAANHAYVFYIEPGAAPLTNKAYWGPPPRTGTPQKALTVNLGPATNVSSISFNYDGLAATGVFGTLQDPETNIDMPILLQAGTRVPLLAGQPALPGQIPFARQSLYSSALQCGDGYNRAISYIDALASAQSIVDQSTDKVVTAEGELDGLRYGDLLSAPGVVGLRGAGTTYDGNYYVKSVTHSISKEKYTQKFKLAREGVGSTVSEVQP